MRDLDLSGSLGRNDGFSAHLRDLFPQGIGIKGLIGDDTAAFAAFEQGGGHLAVVNLTGRKKDAQGTPLSVGEQMDFGGQSASGTPQILVLVPPFPVAACWWARTSVLSIMTYSLSASAIRLAKMRSQTPALAQRQNRLWTDLYLPYREGRSCQRAPDRKTHKTALTNSRLSSPLRPGSPRFPSKNFSIRAYCKSVSSYRFAIPCAPNRLIRGAMNQNRFLKGIVNVDRT